MQYIVKKRNVDYLVNQYSSVSSIIKEIKEALNVNETEEVSAQLWKNEKDTGDVEWIMKVIVPLSKGETLPRTIVRVIEPVTDVGQSLVYNSEGILLPPPTEEPNVVDLNDDEEYL